MLEPDLWFADGPYYLDVGGWDDIGTDWVVEFSIDNELMCVYGQEIA